MRLYFAFPLLLTVAACNVESDPQNDQVVLEYDQNQVENTAADVGNAAEDVANEAGNIAEDVGEEAENVVENTTAE